MRKAFRILRYDWPLHFVLLLTNWLPDNVIFLRLRGILASPFFGSCGKQLRLGRNLTFYNPANIRLGNWIYIASGCWFSAGKPLIIGDEVMFGPQNIVATTNHTMKDGSYRFGISIGKSVSIGRGSWIAGNCVILQGVNLAEGCLVAANSVVNKSFEKCSIVGGSPARIIKNTHVETR